MEKDVEAAAAALLALAQHNIPVDVQELLINGNADRDIRPGALSAAIKATVETYRKPSVD